MFDTHTLSMNPTVCLLIPCYQEEDIITDSLYRLTVHLNQLILTGKVSSDSFVGIVDDGSTDQTWQFILDFKKKILLHL